MTPREVKPLQAYLKDRGWAEWERREERVEVGEGGGRKEGRSEGEE